MSRDTQTLVRAFKVYVRPIVEYCSVIIMVAVSRERRGLTGISAEKVYKVLARTTFYELYRQAEASRTGETGCTQAVLRSDISL